MVSLTKEDIRKSIMFMSMEAEFKGMCGRALSNE